MAIGTLAWRQGDAARAAETYEQVLARARPALGPEHPRVLVMMSNLATVYTFSERLKEAEALLREVTDTRIRTFRGLWTRTTSPG